MSSCLAAGGADLGVLQWGVLWRRAQCPLTDGTDRTADDGIDAMQRASAGKHCGDGDISKGLRMRFVRDLGRSSATHG